MPVSVLDPYAGGPGMSSLFSKVEKEPAMNSSEMIIKVWGYRELLAVVLAGRETARWIGTLHDGQLAMAMQRRLAIPIPV
jgi:hypothetical protein